MWNFQRSFSCIIDSFVNKFETLSSRRRENMKRRILEPVLKLNSHVIDSDITIVEVGKVRKFN